ncbi:MAG: DUF4830 domain-containing protein [Clostridia bacterium]|nr:DUF4830 domain-containing protein [Clostridia bacterium]
MRFYHTLTRSRLLAVLAALIFVILLAGQTASSLTTEQDGKTHALRIGFLERLGYRVTEESVEIKTVTIPQDFSAVYARYNDLQKQAGYNLSNYRGCAVTAYRYALAEDPDRFVTLLVYQGNIIGGDVSDSSFHGTMEPLKR